jgi:hypothetical protein
MSVADLKVETSTVAAAPLLSVAAIWRKLATRLLSYLAEVQVDAGEKHHSFLSCQFGPLQGSI